jgi:hypothetical protein
LKYTCVRISGIAGLLLMVSIAARAGHGHPHFAIVGVHHGHAAPDPLVEMMHFHNRAVHHIHVMLKRKSNKGRIRQAGYAYEDLGNAHRYNRRLQTWDSRGRLQVWRAMAEQYNEAEMRLKAINEEVAKQDSDEAKIQEWAKNFEACMYKARKMKKTKKIESQIMVTPS